MEMHAVFFLGGPRSGQRIMMCSKPQPSLWFGTHYQRMGSHQFPNDLSVHHVYCASDNIAAVGRQMEIEACCLLQVMAQHNSFEFALWKYNDIRCPLAFNELDLNEAGKPTLDCIVDQMLKSKRWRRLSEKKLQDVPASVLMGSFLKGKPLF